nr:hypothetical protein [Tanacetum cinerariifolium]
MVLSVEKKLFVTEQPISPAPPVDSKQFENSSPYEMLQELKFMFEKQAGVESFGVDVVEDFKEYTLRGYYCWLKTYCCWYKLKLLDNAVASRLRLLEQSATVDDKLKKYH